MIPLGTSIFHAVRLRRLDGEPLLLEYVYLSEAAFPGISDRALSSSSLYSVLEEEYGADLSVGQETISVTYVDAWEARNLRVSEGSPAFFVRSVVTDGGGTPVEYCKSVIRSDRIQKLLRALVRAGFKASRNNAAASIQAAQSEDRNGQS